MLKFSQVNSPSRGAGRTGPPLPRLARLDQMLGPLSGLHQLTASSGQSVLRDGERVLCTVKGSSGEKP